LKQFWQRNLVTPGHISYFSSNLGFRPAYRPHSTATERLAVRISEKPAACYEAGGITEMTPSIKSSVNHRNGALFKDPIFRSLQNTDSVKLGLKPGKCRLEFLGGIYPI
jgi:hypothetical protein